MSFDNEGYDIEVELHDFYVLESLSHRISTLNEYRRMLPSVSALEADIERTKARHESLMLRAIRDYLTVVSFCEARYGVEHAEVALSYGYNRLLRSTVPTDILIDAIVAHDPFEFLPELIYLFERGRWTPSYGGEAWAKIAAIALDLWKEKIPSSVMIDMVADIVHNDGLVFDKGVIFKETKDGKRIHKFLSDKSRYQMEDWISLKCSQMVSSLVHRACVLHVIDFAPLAEDEIPISTKRLLDDGYEDITWGNNPWPYGIEEVFHCGECGEAFIEDDIMFTSHGEILCIDCYEETLAHCDICDRDMEKDDLKNIHIHDGRKISVCDKCIKEEVEKCMSCDRRYIFTEDAAHHIDGDPYCDRCLDDIRWQRDNGFIFPHYDQMAGVVQYSFFERMQLHFID